MQNKNKESVFKHLTCSYNLRTVHRPGVWIYHNIGMREAASVRAEDKRKGKVWSLNFFYYYFLFSTGESFTLQHA